MERNELLNRIKLVVIIALIIGIAGVFIYLIYGFALIWQAITASVIIIILSILAIIFLCLSLYLWIKNLLLKRELDKQRDEIEKVSHKLKNCNRSLREKRSSDKEA